MFLFYFFKKCNVIRLESWHFLTTDIFSIYFYMFLHFCIDFQPEMLYSYTTVYNIFYIDFDCDFY